LLLAFVILFQVFIYLPLQHAPYFGSKVVGPQDLEPLVIDGLPLPVQYVVVLEEVLADVKVVALHRGLGALDGLAHQAVFDGEIFSDLFHELGQHLFATKSTHQVVFQRKVEARRARLTLAAGASAKLVVDAPGLVALGAQDVEPARLQRPFATLCVLGGHLGNSTVHLIGRGAKGIQAPCLQSLMCFVDNLVRELAAQLDVDTTAGHVGGDGHRSRLAGPGDDGCLTCVLLGVEHLVGNAFAQGALEEAAGAAVRGQTQVIRDPVDVVCTQRIGIHTQIAGHPAPRGAIHRLQAAVHDLVEGGPLLPI
jgi:hypothetical protein